MLVAMSVLSSMTRTRMRHSVVRSLESYEYCDGKLNGETVKRTELKRGPDGGTRPGRKNYCPDTVTPRRGITVGPL